ncbi:MAG: hypothetical protein ACTSPD_18160 [Promethearchaeota archaeon]
MKVPYLNRLEESWDEKKERVLIKLSRRGKKFLDDKHKKLEELKRNPPKIF